jgi:hypothetical protein
MAYYRLYFFDGSGRIQRFREFELDHDWLAIQHAAAWRSIEAMELWTGTQRVRRWEVACSGTPRSTLTDGSRLACTR